MTALPSFQAKPRGIIHAKPSITIFADASVYQEHGKAGWGGWARGDGRESILRGGPAPFSKNSTIVELWALALMIEHIGRDSYLSELDQSILLQSDSLQALRILNTELSNSWVSARETGSSDIAVKSPAKGDEVTPVGRILSAMSDRGVVYLRHVKGHKGGGNSRSWVNEQCDKRAKSEARAQFVRSA